MRNLVKHFLFREANQCSLAHLASFSVQRNKPMLWPNNVDIRWLWLRANRDKPLIIRRDTFSRAWVRRCFIRMVTTDTRNQERPAHAQFQFHAAYPVAEEERCLVQNSAVAFIARDSAFPQHSFGDPNVPSPALLVLVIGCV